MCQYVGKQLKPGSQTKMISCDM